MTSHRSLDPSILFFLSPTLLPPIYSATSHTKSRQARTAARKAEEGGTAAGLFGQALRAADAVTDAETAAMLLRPFRIENLTDANVNSYAKIADKYGQQWTAELRRTWFGGDQPSWAYVGGQERPQWVSDWLPGLCQGLHATGGAGRWSAYRFTN